MIIGFVKCISLQKCVLYGFVTEYNLIVTGGAGYNSAEMRLAGYLLKVYIFCRVDVPVVSRFVSVSPKPDQDNACVGKEDFMKTNKTYRLVVTAMLIAIATVLNEFATFESPFFHGGGVTVFSQVPIIALSYIFGVRWGLISGFTFSLVQTMFGFANFGYVRGFIGYMILVLADYILPYTLLGLGGVFKSRMKNQRLALVCGSVMVCFIRFICHVFSGVTIWGDYTQGNAFSAVFAYSLSYNAGYMIPETVITVLGVLALNKFLFPKLDSAGMIQG